jgi:hypothetical protein
MELATAVSTGGIAKRARLPRGLPTWDHSQYQLDCYDARITMSLFFIAFLHFLVCFRCLIACKILRILKRFQNPSCLFEWCTDVVFLGLEPHLNSCLVLSHAESEIARCFWPRMSLKAQSSRRTRCIELALSEIAFRIVSGDASILVVIVVYTL